MAASSASSVEMTELGCFLGAQSVASLKYLSKKMSLSTTEQHSNVKGMTALKQKSKAPLIACLAIPLSMALARPKHASKSTMTSGTEVSNKSTMTEVCLDEEAAEEEAEEEVAEEEAEEEDAEAEEAEEEVSEEEAEEELKWDSDDETNLKRLERLNKGPFKVDWDVLLELRDKKMKAGAKKSIKA